MRSRTYGYEYKMPIETCMSDDASANLAFFLLVNTGSVCGRFTGHLYAKDQRTLTGEYHGKGRFVIDGGEETFRMFVTVGFGLDSDLRVNKRWAELRGKDFSQSAVTAPRVISPTRDDDRLITWAECHHLALDIDYLSGKVCLGRRTFDSVANAVRWVESYSKNFAIDGTGARD